jgi:hypothetical protein
MSNHRERDDDALLDELAALIERVDPVPRGVREAALAALPAPDVSAERGERS